MKSRRIDIKGQRFGRLTILSYVGTSDGNAVWLCKCDCGNLVHKRGDLLRRGLAATSCGCGRVSQRKDITGERYGKLTAVRYLRTEGKRSIWELRCDCGNTIEAPAYTLKRRKSCGCQNIGERSITHGETRAWEKTRIYRIWRDIKTRCTNQKCIAYPHYGGRGVKRCLGWDDFPTFKEWALTHGYEDHLTIDRIDSNGDYSPDNCRWITRAENTSRARREKILKDRLKRNNAK